MYWIPPTIIHMPSAINSKSRTLYKGLSANDICGRDTHTYIYTYMHAYILHTHMITHIHTHMRNREVRQVCSLCTKVLTWKTCFEYCLGNQLSEFSFDFVSPRFRHANRLSILFAQTSDYKVEQLHFMKLTIAPITSHCYIYHLLSDV